MRDLFSRLGEICGDGDIGIGGMPPLVPENRWGSYRPRMDSQPLSAGPLKSPPALLQCVRQLLAPSRHLMRRSDMSGVEVKAD